MSLKVQKDLVITFEYELSDGNGTVIDKSEDSGPITYLHGHNNLLPALETELDGRIEAEKFYVKLNSNQAYGEYDNELVCEVPKDQFSSDINIEIGQQFEIEQNGQTCMVYVLEVGDETVTIDGNHPLAGKDLKFDINILEIREPHPEELDVLK